MFDLIIKKGRIIDGTGAPWFRADIGVKDGKIEKMGKISTDALKVINAKGAVVSPGFIDVHSHSDVTVLENPTADSYIQQGITTAVNGNCGSSPAPLLGIAKEEFNMKYSIMRDIEEEWSTFSEYCNIIEKRGVAINTATLIGHGTLRAGVMGKDGFSSRTPNNDELEKMKALLAQSLEEGAYGLSAGLVYPPGVYAETPELIELCKVLVKYRAIFTIHIRGQGDQFLDAVREAIEIGEKSGAPVLLSHHSPNPGMWGKTKISLRWVEEARSRGADISIDKHGYIYGSTSLSTVLPPWAHEGGIKEMVTRLRDSGTRERLRRDIAGDCVWPRVSPALHARAGDWDKIVITSSRTKEHEGESIKQIAESRGVEPVDAVFDLLIENEGVASVKYPAYSEGDLMRVFKHPTSMIATDGSATAPHGLLGHGKPHPKSYGTFPMIFRKYVRDFNLLTLEEGVRKMTSQSAHRFGIWDRGLIAPGMWADIVIFDPDKIADRATIDDPTQYPVGIDFLVVNGVIVLEKGRHSGTLPGKVLRHSEVIEMN